MRSGIIIFDKDSSKIVYLNRCAEVWLSALLVAREACLDTWTDLTFSDLFPEVRESRLRSKMLRGRIAAFITELMIDDRDHPIRWSFTQLDDGNILLEGQDYSSTRETELMLASYSEIVERKNKQLARERRRAERLLLNILPEKSIDQLKQFGRTFPEKFDEVSVMFLDFVGFTQLSQQVDTETLFSELNDIFTQFDTIIKRYRCERIKTIGDAYLAVCGMPNLTENHAQMITCAAYQMRAYIQQRNLSSEHTWRCRIGIHTGEVTGGVVGKLKYIYDIFGDGVNTASRMESYSEPMEINLSPTTRSLLSEAYKLRPRGEIKVKGKGSMEMFFLDHIEGEPCAANLCYDEIISPQDTDTYTLDLPVDS